MVGDVDREEQFAASADARLLTFFSRSNFIIFTVSRCVYHQWEVLVDGRHMVRVLKNRGRGLGSVFLTELSLLGFTFFCVTGLRFLPNNALRAEGTCFSHSSVNSMKRSVPFFSSLYSRDHRMLLRPQIFVGVRNISHCRYIDTLTQEND